jgi:diguanylate cyclase (GGDEF)-like protein
MQLQTMSVAAGPTAFARVTTLAAGVVAATALLDLVTGSTSFSRSWTVVVTMLAAAVAVVPLVLGRRFHPLAGIGGSWLFAAITALQIAAGGTQLEAVNNLVLYPMVSCYLGWFFRPAVARSTVFALFALSGLALLMADRTDVFTTWANLVLASYFCLEAARYLRSRLDRLLVTDPLTGAMNRTGLSGLLREELARSARTGAPLAIAAIDLDGFKLVNDQLGHRAGDQRLTTVVAELTHALRAGNTIARTGGDEFIVLMPGTSFDSATTTLLRLQESSEAPWTFGLVVARPFDTEDSVASRADDDLYAQKRARATTRPPEG